MCIEQYCYLYDELYIGTFYHIENQITKYYTYRCLERTTHNEIKALRCSIWTFNSYSISLNHNDNLKMLL